ncbi:hypothetical protein B0T19DRAFT_8620 [Cercophora scortea]|uniref:Secreted protein n=1 Tax=Cercophora scortea TaxID=314031 RepID=A0AAE0MKG5_9PEZI|nr:hypothetical protein B0T19DRAFT_8620 [Cercophora scortea]
MQCSVSQATLFFFCLFESTAEVASRVREATDFLTRRSRRPLRRKALCVNNALKKAVLCTGRWRTSLSQRCPVTCFLISTRRQQGLNSLMLFSGPCMKLTTITQNPLGSANTCNSAGIEIIRQPRPELTEIQLQHRLMNGIQRQCGLTRKIVGSTLHGTK